MQQLLAVLRIATFVMVKCERPELADQVVEQLRRYYPGNRVILTNENTGVIFAGPGAGGDFSEGRHRTGSDHQRARHTACNVHDHNRANARDRDPEEPGASKRFIVMIIEKEAALISAMG